MSEQLEDKELEEYLRRKSALSLGYKRIYIEAPPQELDRAVAARARRALRWLGPALVAVAIAVGIVLTLNTGIGKILSALVNAERDKRAQEAAQPINVDILAAPDLSAASASSQRTQWLEKIKALRESGNAAAADTEQKAFDKTFGDQATK